MVKATLYFVCGDDNPLPACVQAGKEDASNDTEAEFVPSFRFDENEPLCFILKSSVQSVVDKRRRQAEGYGHVVCARLYRKADTRNRRDGFNGTEEMRDGRGAEKVSCVPAPKRPFSL
jgi:hypothetical protein